MRKDAENIPVELRPYMAQEFQWIPLWAEARHPWYFLLFLLGRNSTLHLTST